MHPFFTYQTVAEQKVPDASGSVSTESFIASVAAGLHFTPNLEKTTTLKGKYETKLSL